VRVSIVSADVQQSSHDLVEAAGAVGFLNKPVDAQRVLSLVRGVLAGQA
jgi:FixJ family two-component response regulator